MIRNFLHAQNNSKKKIARNDENHFLSFSKRAENRFSFIAVLEKTWWLEVKPSCTQIFQAKLTCTESMNRV